MMQKKLTTTIRKQKVRLVVILVKLPKAKKSVHWHCRYVSVACCVIVVEGWPSASSLERTHQVRYQSKGSSQ